MRTVEFVVETDEEYGGLGAKWKGRHWADPIQGMGFAHDVLEHPLKDSGDVECEIRAMGASFFVRDYGGYNAQKGSYHTNPGKHWGSELVMQAERYMDNRSQLLYNPGRTTACEEIDGYIAIALEDARKQWCDERDGEPMPAWLKSANERTVYNLARRGYRAAIKRYKDLQSFHLCYCFMQIEEAIDKFLKHAWEGQEAKLVYDIRSGDVRIDELEFDEYA